MQTKQTLALIVCFALAQSASAQWNYKMKKDSMRESEDLYARAVSKNSVTLEFPYSGGTRAMIDLSRTSSVPETIYIGIDRGQIVCEPDGCDIPIKFDGDKVYLWQAYSGDDGNHGIVINERDRPEFITRLKASRQMIVELPIYDHGPEQFTIDTAKLKWEGAPATTEPGAKHGE